VRNERREVIDMDSVPSYEFHKIFRRVSYDVDLKGALDPNEIDRRMKKAQRNFKAEAWEAYNEAERRKLFTKAKNLKILREKGFPVQTIAEASENRYGIVNLTLHYGRKKAEEMKLAFERARLRRKGHSGSVVRKSKRRRFL
jgi:hypothetical protein